MVDPMSVVNSVPMVDPTLMEDPIPMEDLMPHAYEGPQTCGGAIPIVY